MLSVFLLPRVNFRNFLARNILGEELLRKTFGNMLSFLQNIMSGNVLGRKLIRRNHPGIFKFE